MSFWRGSAELWMRRFVIMCFTARLARVFYHVCECYNVLAASSIV